MTKLSAEKRKADRVPNHPILTKGAFTMYGFIRLLLGLVVLCVLFLAIKKSAIVRKRRVCILAFVLVMLAVSFSAWVPFENAFVTFQTPASAFQYVNMKTDVKLTVYGENSCLVVGEKDGVNQYLIVPKASDGWKTDTGYHTKMISSQNFGSVLVCVYRHKKTGDCYLSVLDTEGKPIELHDNCNSKFVASEKANDVRNKTYTTYYAYIPDFSDDYQLVLGGKVYTPAKENVGL